MHRRDLVRILAATSLLPWVPREAGAAIALGEKLHRAAQRADLEALSPPEAELVTAISDLIIPRTDTPGASDVGVTGFVDHLLAHWYADDERVGFLGGLHDLERRAGTGFTNLSVDRQTALLTALDGVTGERGSAESAFATLKSLTVYGYFTSERVMQDLLRDPVMPGRFDGCARI
jgi:gluconate 2-dehydrogenase gamma chain